jgi:hypothetical protein
MRNVVLKKPKGVVLWYPQINISPSFLSIQWLKRFDTGVKIVTGMIHTAANFRTK